MPVRKVTVLFSNKKLLKVEIEEEDAGVLVMLQTLDKSCVL